MTGSTPELELAEKRRVRDEADRRFRALSEQEVGAAEDPYAFADIDKTMEALRHEISVLDGEILLLEQQVSDRRAT
jgi:hypothetical protein